MSGFYSKSDVESRIGLIVLNYQTVEDTIECLNSIRKYYENLTIVVVDNHSLKEKMDVLSAYLEKSENIYLLQLDQNYGFAKGFNKGISFLRKKGFSYIACSNNDILFQSEGILESLLDTQRMYHAAILGPSIYNLNGISQNPCYTSRLTKRDATFLLFQTSLPVIFLKLVLPSSVLSYLDKLVQKRQNPGICALPKNAPCEVYSLHGAFILFAPPFFEKNVGFDDYTFLYGEELILSEMMVRQGLSEYYDPRVRILHKEDRTSDFVWGGQKKLEPYLIARRSMKYWYSHYFKKNLTKIRNE
ncbi:glycosyltransferase [Methanogenium organophilum]|uniref:Glycosyltransferase n=1 Tax=Methanogenium organophilum TaxID=2199 RepID=A0A9X9S2S3_METOG|nr:glycosyltransferase [Methanogenium organophilum]WAI00829.1 glycosyltransferase [Methanogenium organophilum]